MMSLKKIVESANQKLDETFSGDDQARLGGDHEVSHGQVKQSIMMAKKQYQVALQAYKQAEDDLLQAKDNLERLETELEDTHDMPGFEGTKDSLNNLGF